MYSSGTHIFTFSIFYQVFFFFLFSWLSSIRQLLYYIKYIIPYFFFLITNIILALLSPSLPVVTQIRGGIAGSPSSSPPRYVPYFLIARGTQHFLPSSPRVELCWNITIFNFFTHLIHYIKKRRYVTSKQ